MIFNGKKFASEIEGQLINKVRNLVKRPKIVSVLVGSDAASILYTRLKKQAAERAGIEFEVISEKGEVTSEKLEQIVTKIGEREDVTGVMVQLPLPENFKGATLKVIEAIPINKDVDGLRWEESGVMPATVKAILSILDKIAESQIINSPILQSAKYVVLGARGAVGGPLVYFLKKRGVEVVEIEWDTPDPTGRLLEGEVIISCVGKAGIVTGEMVRDGVVAIDVGMSEKITNQKFSNSPVSTVVGDMTDEVYQKASVAVPVPGGVGPVTIACLMQNVLELQQR